MNIVSKTVVIIIKNRRETKERRSNRRSKRERSKWEEGRKTEGKRCCGMGYEESRL